MRSGSGFAAGVPHQTAPGFCLFPPPPPPIEPHCWERLASTGKDGWKALRLRITPWETGRPGTKRDYVEGGLAERNPGTAEGAGAPGPGERDGRRGRRGSLGESGNAAPRATGEAGTKLPPRALGEMGMVVCG